jgi:Arylsulfotransferase (ASST)
VTDSYKPVGEPYDYLHVNSIDVAPDGNLLISARHTWALYKVDRRTGEVMWRLGGKRSDFSMGKDAQFSWQHDARMPTTSRISRFDDGSGGPQTTEKHSRGLVLDVDESHRSVKVAQSYRHPRSLLASAMGSVQLLPGGDVLVGWGTAPYTAEFLPDGTLTAAARLPSPLYSYRARRSVWQGAPSAPPDVAALPTHRLRELERRHRRGGLERARRELPAPPGAGGQRPAARV